MSDKEVYKIINKEPIEYENLLKDIKIRADSNKNLDGKSECKLLMRYLKKQWQEIERLNKGLDELEELCKTKYYEKNTTDIDSIAITSNLYVYMYKKIKELKGSDKE